MAMKVQLSGVMVQVTLGPGVTSRMSFKTSLRQRILLDPNIPGAGFCIPEEDLANNPTLFIGSGPCT